MKSFTTLKNYFSKTELILWSTSVVLILIAFFVFVRTRYINRWTKLFGVKFSLITWLKNPFNGNRSEVEIYHIKRHDIVLMSVLTAVVTILFYFILKAFNTANLIPSTISVTTSFLAVYLTFKRSPYYAAGYAANDLILIILWTMASMEDISCLSVTVCFAAFFVNDIYGFLNWRRMGQRQAAVAAGS